MKYMVVNSILQFKMFSLLICLSHLQAELVVLCFPIQFLNLCVWWGPKAAPAPEPWWYVFLHIVSKTHAQNDTLLMSTSCIKTPNWVINVLSLNQRYNNSSVCKLYAKTQHFTNWFPFFLSFFAGWVEKETYYWSTNLLYSHSYIFHFVLQLLFPTETHNHPLLPSFQRDSSFKPIARLSPQRGNHKAPSRLSNVHVMPPISYNNLCMYFHTAVYIKSTIYLKQAAA